MGRGREREKKVDFSYFQKKFSCPSDYRVNTLKTSLVIAYRKVILAKFVDYNKHKAVKVVADLYVTNLISVQ